MTTAIVVMHTILSMRAFVGVVTGLEELTMVKSKMELPQWWDKMDLIEYEGGTPDELQVSLPFLSLCVALSMRL